MDDLISRAAAIESFSGKPPEYYHTSYIIGELNSVPVVDAVPVVRCKDCIYWESNTLTHFWKPCDVVKTDKDWYCPCGRR